MVFSQEASKGAATFPQSFLSRWPGFVWASCRTKTKPELLIELADCYNTILFQLSHTSATCCYCCLWCRRRPLATGCSLFEEPSVCRFVFTQERERSRWLPFWPSISLSLWLVSNKQTPTVGWLAEEYPRRTLVHLLLLPLLT